VAVVAAVVFILQAHRAQAVQAAVAQAALQVHPLQLAQREAQTQAAVAVVLDTLKDPV
jgi:hypothetical protein